jgi:hypothetical protein
MMSDPVAPRPTYCEEKERLVDEYGAAVNEYSRTVRALRSNLVLPKAEYDQIQAFSEETRVRCEAARAALEQHIAAHGC